MQVIFKQEKGNTYRTPFYRLVESYRYDNMVRQHTILHLGKLEELPEVAHNFRL
jgi:hypothetical protein